MPEINWVAFAGIGFAIIIPIIITAKLSAKFVLFKQAKQRTDRFKRGAQGEKDAIIYLKKNGWKIIGEQVENYCTYMVGGNEVKYLLKADIMAKKNGKKAIIEVKTGKLAPSPKTIETRRQLLDYFVNYEIDEVWLFDADRNKMSQVNFPEIAIGRRRQPFKTIFILTILVAAQAYIIFEHL